MKKTWDIFLLFIFTFTLGSCSFCKVKPDREVFSKMDPIEWKDEYVFSATWYPSQIQVWNSKTNKLEHTYELCTDNENWVNGKSRYIDVMCMSVINKCIWFIGWGWQSSLIRLEVETGEMKYIDLDFSPEEVVAIPEENNGKGTIVVASHADPRYGVKVNVLDTEGNILVESDIEFNHIDMYSLRNCFYEDGNYYVPCCEDYGNIGGKLVKTKVIKLVDKKQIYITDVPTEKIINKQTQDKFFSGEIEEFSSSVSLMTCKNETNRFMEMITIYDTNEKTCIDERFLFKINSLKNWDIEYTGIKFAKEYSKSMFSVAEYEDNIFITGRVLCDDPDGFSGLEVGMYPAVGGDEIQRCRLPEGNQLYCHMTEDATWFSKNLFEYIDHPYPEKPEWNTNTTAGIYKLDYKTKQVYEFNADGSYKILPWILP